jgi:hypothetical protein
VTPSEGSLNATQLISSIQLKQSQSLKQLRTLKVPRMTTQTQLTELAVPSRLSKFENEFEMFLYYLWNRQDPFA